MGVRELKDLFLIGEKEPLLTLPWERKKKKRGRGKLRDNSGEGRKRPHCSVYLPELGKKKKERTEKAISEKEREPFSVEEKRGRDSCTAKLNEHPEGGIDEGNQLSPPSGKGKTREGTKYILIPKKKKKTISDAYAP